MITRCQAVVSLGKTVVYSRNNPNATDEDEVSEIGKFLGADNAGGVFVQPISANELPEDQLKIVTFQSQYNDKMFESTTERVKSNIYGSFDNILPILVESGGGQFFGANPETFELAQDLYFKRTEKKRMFLQRTLSDTIGVEFELLAE